jgi:hypothetical protein
VYGGLGLFGTGAGIGYLVSEGLGLYAAFNLIAGFPSFMIHGDMNAGVMIVK